jgi:hypothetical protein
MAAFTIIPHLTIAPSGGADQVWQFISGPDVTKVSGVYTEPTWPSVGATFTDLSDGGGNVWKYLGAKAKYNYSKFIDDPLIHITPQVETNWANLARSKVVQQKIINSGALTVVHAYALPDNATTVVSVEVAAKQSEGTSSPDGASFSLKGVWYRNAAGAPVQVKAPTVTDSNPNATGTAWSAVLALNGNNVEVRVAGDAAKTITWTVIREGLEGVQL